MIGTITALALGAGALSAGYGAYENYEGKQQQQAGYKTAQQGSQLQQQAAQQQAGISKEQAATSVVYAGQERDLNTLAAQQSAQASTANLAINQSTIHAQQQVEAQKRSAMELDARRNQLEIIRTQQRARSLGLSNATMSGSSKGSGLQGGYGQASGQAGVNLLGVQQNLQIGENIFDQNANISNNNIATAELQNNYALQQAANQTSKASMVYSLATANAGYQTRMADTQTLASQGAGLVAQGQGQAAMGAATSQMGSSFISAGTNIFSMGLSADKLFAGNTSNIFGSSFSSTNAFNPFSWTS